MNKLRAGDDVIVIAGKDRSKRGVVISRADDDHLVVGGVNIAKKHTKPNPMKNVTGGVVDKAMPIHQSNVAIFNAVSGKADRVGIKTLMDGSRVRIYKSSGEEVKVNFAARKSA